VDLAKDPGCDRAWAKGASLMVNDCRNRFWLLARAVEDNGSTLRAQSSTTVFVVKGPAIEYPGLAAVGIPPLTTTAESLNLRVLFRDKLVKKMLEETRRRSVVPPWKNQE